MIGFHLWNREIEGQTTLARNDRRSAFPAYHHPERRSVPGPGTHAGSAFRIEEQQIRQDSQKRESLCSRWTKRWRQRRGTFFSSICGHSGEVSSERGVPTYVIFFDRSLHEMVEMTPRSRSAFCRSTESVRRNGHSTENYSSGRLSSFSKKRPEETAIDRMPARNSDSCEHYKININHQRDIPTHKIQVLPHMFFLSRRIEMNYVYTYSQGQYTFPDHPGGCP
jgi:hypothetical protein